ncbi:MAG TPA: hypothetical protein VFL13_12005 [Candidatus Baltobacteraceae bacterium]|nr:hypothetical protein [Candidatus Baltobacteraceae bacterium]
MLRPLTLVFASLLPAAIASPFFVLPAPLKAQTPAGICAGNRTPPPWAHNRFADIKLSDAQRAAVRANELRFAAHQRMYIEPATEPYHFVLSVRITGEGDRPPTPQVDLTRFTAHLISSEGRDYGSHVRISAKAPQPVQAPNPCDTIVPFRAGLTIETRGLPPDLYSLSARAPIASFKLRDGTEITGANASVDGWHLYVPRPPRPAPALRIGQQFLVLPEASSLYYDEEGREILRSQIAMHPATLALMTPQRWTFSVEGFSRRIAIEPRSDWTQISGLPPLVSDANVTSLNERYDGKRVWGRGGLAALCAPGAAGAELSFGAPATESFIVKRVFRVYKSSYEFGIGPQVGAWSGGRQSSFVDESPVVIWLDVPKNTKFVSSGGYSPGAGTPSGSGDGACAAYFTMFSDAWDMDRAYTFSASPYAQSEVAAGMTREQVARILGYPAVYGPVEKIMASKAWRYDNLPPFSYWVYFDDNGRVTKFGTDGRLP